jgi:hypothetical protein
MKIWRVRLLTATIRFRRGLLLVAVARSLVFVQATRAVCLEKKIAIIGTTVFYLAGITNQAARQTKPHQNRLDLKRYRLY